MRQGTINLLTLFFLVLTGPFLLAQQPAELPEKGQVSAPVAPSTEQVAAQQPAQLPENEENKQVGTPAPIAPSNEQPVATPTAAGQSNGLGLMGGGSFYFVRPYLHNNTAFVTAVNGGQPNAQNTSEPFHWDFQPAFAGWIGWTSASGLGIRSRYFLFSERSESAELSNGFSPPPQTQTFINLPLTNFLAVPTGGFIPGSPGSLLTSGFGTDHLTFGSDLRIQTIDLEITYRMDTSYGLFQAFGGGRYLNLAQGYHATLINNGEGAPAPISETQTFDASREFQGGGPTFGLEWDLPIGRTGLSVYANARGSLLVGNSKEAVSFSSIVNDPNGLIHPVPPAVVQINPTASRSSDAVIPSAEVELGFEYGHRVGRTWLFFRGGAVSQTYFDAGNASQSTGNFSLFGAQATFGIAY